MKTAIYVRISKTQGGGDRHGVDHQERDCRAEADRRGWQVVEVFEDNDITASGKKPRPAYEGLMDAIERGAVDALLIRDTDRLYRRPLELERLIDLVESRCVEVQTLRSGSVDLSSASGRAHARGQAVQNRYEIEKQRERMLDSHRNRAIDGKHRGGARPFGWDEGLNTVPEEADAIREATAKLLRGESLRGIAAEFNKRGLPSARGAEWTPVSVRKVVARARNAGLVELRGKILEGVQGKWEPLVSPDEFYGVRALLADPSRKRSHVFKRRYPGVGVYRCGRVVEGRTCGKPLESSSDHRGRAVYRCRNLHLSREVAHVDANIAALVVERLGREDFGLILARNDVEIDVVGLQAERDSLVEQKRAAAAAFADRDMGWDFEQIKIINQRLNAKINNIDEQLVKARTVSPTADLLLQGDDLAEAWSKASPTVQGKIIAELMDVTLLAVPASERNQPFNFDYVQITWKV
ncbi:recombinase family protein [Antrihabitans sp. YC2-6]|uniref:recombinase family protein n=1 Tax=Antrihabitans sp. YC2-6 TaxID=2799498 RepID=UPI0018F3DE82|nr:recombinase family protein [Antrihabitans sp. YC2-6]MBJ8348584.1 recombinase family protein [Antrihabitans sp. YC2-6]